jgi:hypothetical protein
VAVLTDFRSDLSICDLLCRAGGGGGALVGFSFEFLHSSALFSERSGGQASDPAHFPSTLFVFDVLW